MKRIIIYFLFVALLGCEQSDPLIITNESCQKVESNIEPPYMLFDDAIFFGTSPRSSVIDREGNVLIAGTSLNSNIIVLKLTVLGELLWEREIRDLDGLYRGDELHIDVHGNIFVLGKSRLESGGFGSEFSIVKISEDGDSIWQRKYNYSTPIEAKSMIVSSSGYVYVCAQTNRVSPEIGYDLVLYKITPSGILEFSQTYVNIFQEIVSNIIQLKNEDLLVSSVTNPNGTFSTLSLTRINKNGNQIFNKEIQLDRVLTISETILLNDGYQVVCGSIYNDDNSDIQALVILLDENSNITWQHEYGRIDHKEKANDIVDGLNGFSVSGEIGQCGSINTDNYTIHLNKDGVLINSIFQNEFGIVFGSSINKTSSERNIITGFLNGDSFMLNVDNNGN